MPSEIGNRRDVERPWWPRLREQSAIAVAVAASLVMMAVYAWYAGAWNGRLIDFDTAAPLSAEFRVNLNEASWIEIAQLPATGETLARRIVEWREEHGALKGLDDLRRVKGIGPKTIAAIEPYILFGPISDRDAETTTDSPHRAIPSEPAP